MTSATFIDPVYVKHYDLFECEEISTLSICNEINNYFPNKVVGAQQIEMLWYIYMKDEISKSELIEGGFKLDGITVRV